MASPIGNGSRYITQTERSLSPLDVVYAPSTFSPMVLNAAIAKNRMGNASGVIAGSVRPTVHAHVHVPVECVEMATKAISKLLNNKAQTFSCVSVAAVYSTLPGNCNL